MTRPQRQATRAQRTTVVTGILCFLLILVVLQLCAASPLDASDYRSSSNRSSVSVSSSTFTGLVR
jgi:hypothetical protein